MTLVKTKHRAPVHHKKISGDHHHKNQRYLKTYWPYIPIVLILGGAFLANDYLPSNQLSSGSTSAYSTRVETLMGINSNVLLGLLYAVLVVLAAWYVFRHLKRIKSLAMEGEQYLARHYFLDIALGAIIGSLYVLVR
ncbi:MAG TPA: hypothetical protein VGF75_03325 [Candidatus Saccharimonadales bacterium]|jgi:hypothetical protein